MALVLKLQVGSDLWIGGRMFVLTELFDGTSFRLQETEGPDAGAEHKITEECSTEIMPDVFVSAGDLHEDGAVQVVLDAPREILILRGDRYRKQLAEGTAP